MRGAWSPSGRNIGALRQVVS